MTRALVAKGARVIMAVRNEAKGRAALETPAGRRERAWRSGALDLADLDSVRAFADGLHAGSRWRSTC